MTMLKNTPEHAKNIEDGRRFEREAAEAEEAGDMARARKLYERADLCYALNDAERRLEGRRAAARVANMETPGIMVGAEGTSILDD